MCPLKFYYWGLDISTWNKSLFRKMQKRLLTQLELQSGIIQIFPKSGNIWICLEMSGFLSFKFFYLDFMVFFLVGSHRCPILFFSDGFFICKKFLQCRKCRIMSKIVKDVERCQNVDHRLFLDPPTLEVGPIDSLPSVS